MMILKDRMAGVRFSILPLKNAIINNHNIANLADEINILMQLDEERWHGFFPLRFGLVVCVLRNRIA